ncbi:MAG: nucleoside triphosphate pyrophosphatase [Deltaproteobacteria bacterium]|nr:nucleoside triphosphate pyrophosphatase [Deltaproteobacteria bacterium]
MKPVAFPLIRDTYPLILASESPRRSELMAQAGIPFRIVVSGVEEVAVSQDPAGLACVLARRKTLEVSAKTDPSWILGADTLVVVEDRILGKPEDKADARDMLLQLSGSVHQVITGFCLSNPAGEIVHSEAVTTDVYFKKLSVHEITAYVATGEPEGKAGAYAIQGIGAFMVASISGSYTNVVGLPLCAVIKALVRTGALEQYPFNLDAAVLKSRTI